MTVVCPRARGNPAGSNPRRYRDRCLRSFLRARPNQRLRFSRYDIGLDTVRENGAIEAKLIRDSWLVHTFSYEV